MIGMEKLRTRTPGLPGGRTKDWSTGVWTAGEKTL